jgi:hypothetical protein
MPLRRQPVGNHLWSSAIGVYETAYFLYIPTHILVNLVSYRKSRQHYPGAGITHRVNEMHVFRAAKKCRERPSPVPDKCAVLQLAHSLPQFSVGIHHDWSIPRHRLLQWLA